MASHVSTPMGSSRCGSRLIIHQHTTSPFKFLQHSLHGPARTANGPAHTSAWACHAMHQGHTISPRCPNSTTASAPPHKRAHRDLKCSSASSSSGYNSFTGQGPVTDVLTGMLMAYANQLQQQQGTQKGPGAALRVKDLNYHPPGAERPLLDSISMEVAPHSLALLVGRSGCGKTTLLQVLAGLCEQSSGQVLIGDRTTGPEAADGGASLAERMQRVGLVFQFPERHFLGHDIFSELTFTWPRRPEYAVQQQQLRLRVTQVLQAVNLQHLDMSLPPWALSGGQQRRLALAIQLVRQPRVLLLDEPLAGLDWQSRQEVVELLRELKKQCTLVVVSHDIKEIAPLVDCAWGMKLGGTMERMEWPPADMAALSK